jgi:hypothetical protein
MTIRLLVAVALLLVGSPAWADFCTARNAFTWNEADAATTTYDVSTSCQAKVIIVWLNGTASATTTADSDNFAYSMGFGTSTTDRRGASYVSADGQATALIGVRHSNAAILVAGSVVDGSDIGALDISAIDADSVTFIVDTQLGAGSGNQRVQMFVFGGSDVTAQGTLQFQEASATAAHGLGCTPAGALFITAGFATAPAAGGAAQGMFSFGASDGTRSFVVYNGGDDNNTTMDTRSYAKSGEAIAMGPEPAVTTNARVATPTFDGTDISLTWTESASTRYVHAVAWCGGQFRVDNLLSETTTTTVADTGYGFQPVGAMFASAGRAESTADTPTDTAQWSLGAATSTTDRQVLAAVDEDGVGTSEGATAINTAAVYINTGVTPPNTGTHTNVGVADLQSFDSDGLTIVMTDADPAQAFVGVLAWAGNAVVGGDSAPARTLLGVGK